MDDADLIISGVVIAQPFPRALSFYGINDRALIPPHGHGLGPSDITISSATGRVLRIRPTSAATFPRSPPPVARPSTPPPTFADVPLTPAPDAAPAPAGGDDVVVLEPRDANTAPAAAAAAAAAATAPAEPTRVTFSGAAGATVFAWPGLIDSSVHALPALADPDGASARLFNLLYLLHGVTSVRHTWVGDEGLVAATGREVALCGSPGPRHFFSGAPLGAGTGESAAAEAARLSAVGGACAVQVEGALSRGALGAAASAATAAGVALLGHPCREAPLGLCALDDALHLAGVPPVPAFSFGSEPRAFAAWVGAWSAVGVEELQKAALVLRRERVCATPCLGRYWMGAQAPLPGLRGGVEAAHEGGGSGDGAPLSAQAVMDAVAGGGGDKAPAACAAAAVPPPTLSVLAGVPAPRSAACARYACAWLPPVVPNALWVSGSLTRALAPTFAAPLPPDAAAALPAAFPAMLAAVKALAAAGVPVHAGSDALAPGCLPGGGLHVELALLRGAGLSDEEALGAATALPGAFLAALPKFCGGSGAPGTPAAAPAGSPPPALAASRLAWLGFLCEGAPADLVISAVDPRADLTGALGSIVAVVAAGVLHRREDLEAALWAAREGPGRENLAAALTTLFTQTLPVAPLLSDALNFFGFGGK